VPQVILRRFVSQDGHLFAYDENQPHEGIRRRSPSMVLRERNL
jgi:hypothetical protein